ncbi:MAG: hypothetical protein IKL16_01285, partial [Clostridia bacterium]|nr:hypothetical protein [Clostridia bacterium]
RETIVVDALGHTEVIDEAVAPDCVNTGLTEGSHCEVCGEVIVAQEVVDALGHTEETTTVDATCTEVGSITTVCTVCGETISEEEIPALGHTEVIDEAVAPDCVNTGLTEGSHCEVCGEVIVAQEVVDALGHTDGEWVMTKEPSVAGAGEETLYCAVCGEAIATRELAAVEFITNRIHMTVDGKNIRFDACVNAHNIAFNTKTAAGSEIVIDTDSVVGKTSKGDRYVVYYKNWAKAGGEDYTTTMTIDGVEYNLTVSFSERELEANDIVPFQKHAGVSVDNESKVITLTAPKGIDEIRFNEVSRQCDEFTYLLAEDENVIFHAREEGESYGSYSIVSNGADEVYKTVTVNDGRYCEEEYTLHVVFVHFEVEDSLKPLRGTITMEADETGDEYIKVTMRDGQTSVGIYKDTIGDATTNVTVEITEGNVIEKDNMYVAYAGQNTTNPKGTATIHLANGGEVVYDIVFDMGLEGGAEEPETGILDDIRLIRSTASFDEDGTLRITRNTGLADNAGNGFYATTKSGIALTFTAENGTIYAGRTDAFVAYLSQNTSDVKGTLSYTLADGTVVEYNVIIELGLGEGEEPEVPVEPTFDIASDLRALRGTVSVAGNTVTITMTPGKTMTGIYNTTTSGATVEIKDANGVFDTTRTDAYVAYIAKNTANVEGVMVVTLADGTVYEYKVIFDIGLGAAEEEPEVPDEPEAPAYDVEADLRALRGTVSVADDTVTIKVVEGKTMTGIYNTTTSGATVEIKDANGVFDTTRTDAYVAYIAKNTANVEGIMVVTLADGTVYEYKVIFDLGL